MPKLSRSDRLDQAIAAMLAGTGGEPGPGLAPLVRIARELRDLPRESFRASLKSDLERKVSMASQVTAPAATQTATMRLRVKNAPAAIEFYSKAFGAAEISRFEAHGSIVVAEVRIGNSIIMVSESSPEFGLPGPEAYGGSPVTIHLRVEDVDAFVGKAVAAGAALTEPVADQFYGVRRGSVADSFGYTWVVETPKEELSVDEIYGRFEAIERERQSKKAAESPIPKGYHTITPYIVVPDAPALIDFARQIFGAEETFRTVGGAGGIHAEVRIGDSMLMIGGGGPELSWRGESRLTALHIYVEDTDAAYERALQAGAASLGAPQDQPYGERGAGVKDQFGNYWYIATSKGKSYVPEGLRRVTPYLHPLRAEALISFLKRGFGAEEIAKYASLDGQVHHAQVRIGDSMLEMGEAGGPYQTMPAMFYLYVPNVDATYSRALAAGASSMSMPADQPYGDRTAAVKDTFGNEWYIATHIKDVG
jgi:PhnB protein